MASPKVVFLHGLSRKTVDLITSYAPEGFNVVVVDEKQSEQNQIEAVKDAVFLMV